ncbi:MAG TPA: O-antigen ligase family protein [Ktedonobacteraceae bacterium]|nr:O-antigen ligase family protein [Ktedonobacteraceae bacterium]
MAEDSFARRLALVTCSFILIALISTRAREVWKTLFQSRLFLILPAIACISAAWSQNPAHTLVSSCNLTLTTLFAIYLYARYPKDTLLVFLTGGAAIGLLLSLLAVIFLPSVGIDAYQQDAWRGLFLQKNNCATLCTLFFVLAVHLKPTSTSERMLRFLVIALAILFIVMSGSRTGWVLSLLALVLTCIFHIIGRMSGTDRAATKAALFGLSVVAGVLLYLNSSGILAVLGKDPTLTQRTVIWASVIPSILKHPFLGYGFGAFWSGMNGESMQTILVTGWMEGQAQSGYLDVLLQLGLIGFCPLVWLFIRALIKGRPTSFSGGRAQMMKVSTVLLVLVLVENIGETSFLDPYGLLWLYSLVAILVLTVRPSFNAVSRDTAAVLSRSSSL